MSDPTARPTALAPSRGFLELDARVTSGASGIVLVHAPRKGARAVVEHLARRVEQSGLAACVAVGGCGAPAFHLAAQDLDIDATTCARSLAEAVASAVQQRRTVLLSLMPEEGSWDRAVVGELASVPRSMLLVLVADRAETLAGAETFVVSDSLDDTERRRYLSAAVEHEARKNRLRSVQDLATFAARLASPGGHARPSHAATVLHSTLACAARPWPVGMLDRLVDAPTDALGELLDAGWLVERDGTVCVVVATVGTEPFETTRVARALLETFQGDPWAESHAAELYVATDPERADALHVAALGKLADPVARRELSRRWAIAARSNRDLMLRQAYRALDVGEHEEALQCIEASGVSNRTVEHSVLLGRALVGTGDLVGGRVAFERARAADGDRKHATAIAVELAEVAYAQGALELARREAMKVVPGKVLLRFALRASNVLGKLLLSEAKWDEADAHFANDAMTAQSAGLVIEHLRARLNRSIAVLSKGLVEEANAMLHAVLADSEAHGYYQGAAFALTNLSATAWDRRDYASALDCLERAFSHHQALGSAPMVAQTTASLADVRLRLGLVEQAAQTIGFGRRSGLSPFRAAKFAFVATRIALARGDVPRARREMEQSIAEASASHDVESLSEAHRLAAMVSLEEGDVAACKRHVVTAEANATNDRARAETLLISALAERASGSSDPKTARKALACARKAGDDDAMGQALILLSCLSHDLGDGTTARALCEQAAAVRDSVAEGLPEHVRAAYLSRPESIAVSRMQEKLAVSTEAEPGRAESPRTERAPRGEEAKLPRREMVGEDPCIRALLTIKKLGRSDATVLIKGESGTGKELVADALHRSSLRASGPLVSLNCAALVETLLISELFGHERGAFTGATTRRRGRFEMAEGGTLFLDEIGDISPLTQVALLRVLQEKVFERVGGTTSVRADVRVVCATHRDLRGMVERGEFREDLYYRLRGVELEVPPLRARPDDIALLAEALLERISFERNEPPKHLSVEAVAILRAHKWPGNVRELENALRAVSLFTDETVIGAQDLLDNVGDLREASRIAPPANDSAPTNPTTHKAVLTEAPSSSKATCVGAEGDDSEEPIPRSEANATSLAYDQVRHGAVSLSALKRQIERDCIVRALGETKGNISRAAMLLGMKRPRLSQLVKQYGLGATVTEGV